MLEYPKSKATFVSFLLFFSMLTDSFGRTHDYLRISLTDVCNFRCTYCMPNESVSFMPSVKLMQVSEIERIVAEFVKLGVKKIRLTGGEPLVRKDAKQIIEKIAQYPVELTLTSNGTRVDELIDTFKVAKIKSINISLDTLNAENFKKITQRNSYQTVINNINLLIKNNFIVKVNIVVMRGFNENEILDFIEWTKNTAIHVRFIEFMPFSGNRWENEKVFNYQEILSVIESKYQFHKLTDVPHATAKAYQISEHLGTFAVISTMSSPFCGDCNRMRLTADGKMKNCLFSKTEIDILSALRNGQDIVPLIKQCIGEKKEALGGQFTNEYQKIDANTITNRTMISIGG